MSKRKKLIQIIILVAMLLGITGIVRYNYEMYDSDIARVVDADNKEDDSGEEPRYTQKLTLKIKNHEQEKKTNSDNYFGCYAIRYHGYCQI